MRPRVVKQVSRSRNINLLLAQGILNVAGGLLAAAIWGGIQYPTLSLTIGLCVISGVMTASLAIVTRRPMTDRFVCAIFGITLLPVYAMLWALDATLATRIGFWVPFQAHELSILTVAILAPPIRWVGVVAICLFVAMAIAQYLTLSPDQIARLPCEVLTAPVAFCVFGLILYFFRLRGLWIAAFAIEKDAESRMMRELTHTLLAVKDLANSPIQALTVDAEMLKRKHPECEVIAERIENSTARLQRLNRLLDERLRGGLDDASAVSLDSVGEFRGFRRKMNYS